MPCAKKGNLTVEKNIRARFTHDKGGAGYWLVTTTKFMHNYLDIQECDNKGL